MKGSVAEVNMSLQLCAATFDACFDICLVLEILFLLLLTTIVALSFIVSALFFTLSLVAALHVASGT